MPRLVATTLDKVWLLEASGAPVADTSVAFAAATGRTIVLRHARPDDAIFLVLQFPATADSLRVHDSIHVTVHPMRGSYAFALSTPDRIASGATAMFSYAIHFRAPSDAAAKYPSPGRFEAQLAPAALGTDNTVRFLEGVRPAADLIRFPVAAPGSYGLAAVR